jgi:hypothetical protein
MNNRLFEYSLALSVAQQRAELRLARKACDAPAEIERLELVLRWLEQPLQRAANWPSIKEKPRTRRRVKRRRFSVIGNLV